MANYKPSFVSGYQCCIGCVYSGFDVFQCFKVSLQRLLGVRNVMVANLYEFILAHNPHCIQYIDAIAQCQMLNICTSYIKFFIVILNCKWFIFVSVEPFGSWTTLNYVDKSYFWLLSALALYLSLSKLLFSYRQYKEVN